MNIRNVILVVLLCVPCHKIQSQNLMLSEYSKGNYITKIIISKDLTIDYQYDILGNRISKTITASGFSISPAQLTLASEANSKATISVKSPAAWQLKTDQSWLTANVYSGSGDATITLTATANTGSSSRVAIITITSGTATQTVQVTQLSAVPTLEINAASMGFREVSGLTSNFSIASNISWTITSSENWLSLSKTSGSNNAEITITINSANTFTADRTALITITGTDGTKKTIQVIQSGTNGTDLSNGLVAYYPFNGNANDESGNNLHGIVRGNVNLTTDRKNNPNRAYQFNGTINDWIEVTNNNLLNLGPSFTVSAWVYKESGSSSYIIGKGRDIDCGTWSLGESSISVNGYCGTYANTPNLLNENQWQMITGVLDGNSGKLKWYLNGQLISEKLTETFTASNSYPLAIGRHITTIPPSYSDPWPYPFKGKLDEIRIYNKALSDNEILSLYQSVDIINQVDEIKKSSLIKVFPNPTTGILTIKGLLANQRNKIAFFTVDGKLLRKKTSSSTSETFDISNLVSGVYILEVNKQVFKILKE